MPKPALVYEKRDGIAYITFNRPQVRNALSPEVFCRLVDAWKDYAADDSLRVAIITGAGDRAFTAGADLGTFIPLLTGARQPEDAWDQRAVENENAQLVLATEDAKEGPRAFMEKRQPHYVGR